jgi:hypothetical protein
MADPLPTLPEESMSSNRDNLPRPDLDPSAAGDLAAIHALLLAIARHNSIEIPKEAGSLATSGSTSDVDPKASSYDEAKTIDYHTRQPGTALTLQDKHDLGPGISSGLLWVSDPFRRDRHVDYGEYGYDENGYVCNLGHRDAEGTQNAPQQGSANYAPRPRENKQHIFKKADGEVLSPPWAGQRFGKEW